LPATAKVIDSRAVNVNSSDAQRMRERRNGVPTIAAASSRISSGP
jgi:hypothetical protein